MVEGRCDSKQYNFFGMILSKSVSTFTASTVPTTKLGRATNRGIWYAKKEIVKEG